MSSPAELIVATATASCGWARELGGLSDDRLLADAARRLFYVVNARGPTYGGYYAPFALDSAMRTMLAAFDAGTGPGHSRLRQAVEAANRHMVERRREHDALFQEEKDRHENRLEAARVVADRLRPPEWEYLRGRSLAHFGASIAAVSVAGDSLAIVQAGNCHVYRRRGGAAERLAGTDPLENPELQSHFKDAPDVAMMFRDVASDLLGFSPELTSTDVEPDLQSGDLLLLCTPGLWAAHDGGNPAMELLQSCASPDRELARVVDDAARKSRSDATAVLLQVP